MIDAADVKWHIENCTEDYHQGGEAAVHIVTWHARGGSSVLPEGQRVALKVYHRPDGRGGFVKIKDEDDVVQEGGCGACCRSVPVPPLTLRACAVPVGSPWGPHAPQLHALMQA